MTERVTAETADEARFTVDEPRLLRALHDEALVGKAEQLARRVYERFPDRNLNLIANELVVIARESQSRIAAISRPDYGLRALIVLLLLLFFAGAYITFSSLSITVDQVGFVDLIQALEAGINDVVFIGAAIYFLVTLENRRKQHQIQRAMSELRALAHVIDMYQLTKDPQRIVRQGPDTPSSPKENMTAFELTRYLDYCSEMLAILGKLAALYAQSDDSSQTIATVNEIEDLTNGLSRKIWQKLMMLFTAIGSEVIADGELINPPLAERRQTS